MCLYKHSGQGQTGRFKVSAQLRLSNSPVVIQAVRLSVSQPFSVSDLPSCPIGGAFHIPQIYPSSVWTPPPLSPYCSLSLHPWLLRSLTAKSWLSSWCYNYTLFIAVASKRHDYLGKLIIQPDMRIRLLSSQNMSVGSIPNSFLMRWWWILVEKIKWWDVDALWMSLYHVYYSTHTHSRLGFTSFTDCQAFKNLSKGQTVLFLVHFSMTLFPTFLFLLQCSLGLKILLMSPSLLSGGYSHLADTRRLSYSPKPVTGD